MATRDIITIPGLKGKNNLAQGIISGGTIRNVAVRLSSRRSLGKVNKKETVRVNMILETRNSFGRNFWILFVGYQRFYLSSEIDKDLL